MAEDDVRKGGRGSWASDWQPNEGIPLIQCYPTLPYKLIDSMTKIRFTAKVIRSQAKNARAGEKTNVIEGETVAIFEFIAPSEIIESISHSWESYDSSASKLQEAAIAGIKGLNEAEMGLKSVLSIAQNATFKDTLQTALAGNVENTRIDVPLVYKNSERRKFEFTFNMGYYDDPDEEIIMPVKTLSGLSCASLPIDKTTGNNAIGAVQAPCLFEIISSPGEIIYIKHAALLTVQPTYRGPFRGGFPSSCELHLSFEEIEPLWSSAFKKQSSVVLSTESITVKTPDTSNLKPGDKGTSAGSNIRWFNPGGNLW